MAMLGGLTDGYDNKAMPVTKTVAAERIHHELVLNDPEYHKDLKASSDIKEVFKRYGLSEDEGLMTMEQYKMFKKGFVPFTGGWMKQDEKSGEFTVMLNADFKKHQLQELWGYIQRTRMINGFTKQPKIKPPDDPQLLYAIFKARVRGRTFPQIFTMYHDGILPSYENKPTNNFSDEFDIKKYYSKYYNPI